MGDLRLLTILRKKGPWAAALNLLKTPANRPLRSKARLSDRL